MDSILEEVLPGSSATYTDDYNRSKYELTKRRVDIAFIDVVERSLR
jgi:hypothetical protein